MLKIYYSSKMKKDIKLLKKRGCDFNKFAEVVDILRKNEQLPMKYKDHALSGNYSNYRECHIEPDWLLIYKIEKDNLILLLSRTGTHSDLF